MRQDLVVPQRGEEGIALVTTLVILLIMTVLGVGAVAVTALENRIAGFQRTGESATSAAESCVGTSVNIIQQTISVEQPHRARSVRFGGRSGSAPQQKWRQIPLCPWKFLGVRTITQMS